jgi:hypothetical protein
VDDTEVHGSDRDYIRDILVDILRFDETQGPLKISIKRVNENYHCLISNWRRPIQFKKFSDRFLDPERRDSKYDLILSDSSVTPEMEGEGGPFVNIRIKARAKNSDTRKKR